MKTLTKKLGMAALLSLGVVAGSQATVLDTFDYQLDMEVNALNLSQISNETTVLGFDALYTLTYGGSSTDFTSNATADTVNIIGLSDGELAYTSAGQTGSVLNVTWTDLNAAPGAFLDLVDGGNQGIYIDLASVDLSFLLDITVSYFDGVGISTSNFSTIVDNSISTPTRLFYSFSNWVGVDFTKVAAVSAIITGEPDADFRITEVGAVPEPSTVAILGLGLLGFGLSRRRKA